MQSIPLERSFVTSGTEQIYFERAGSGAPLIFCHGGSGNHATWFKQVAHFAGTRQVVTWDHRGFGLSTMRSGGPRPLPSSTDLLCILDTLELGQVDLVGQSMGGWTAVHFALAHPDRVRSIILTCTTGGVRTPATWQAWTDLMVRLRAGAPPLMLGRDAALSAEFAARFPAEAAGYQVMGGFNLARPKDIFGPMEEEMIPAERIRELSVPVLAMAGEKDVVFPPQVVFAAAQQFPNVQTHQIEGAGHSAFFEDPDAWNSRVQSFLESIA
jgi:3-oxoadipate enol-lactonase